MKMIETGIKINSKDLKLCPIASDKSQILLYDMYLGEAWQGSRRTVSGCGIFLGVPDLMERLWGWNQRWSDTKEKGIRRWRSDHERTSARS